MWIDFRFSFDRRIRNDVDQLARFERGFGENEPVGERRPGARRNEAGLEPILVKHIGEYRLGRAIHYSWQGHPDEFHRRFREHMTAICKEYEVEFR